MKKAKKPVRVSKTPPPGWPTETEWKELDKKISSGLATQISSNSDPISRTKTDLCSHFVRYFNSEKITQREMARRLEVPESRVSEILHYHHGRFTIDKLLGLLSRIKPSIRIRVA
jgi:predicted XRE-type DNA-binding protein